MHDLRIQNEEWEKVIREICALPSSHPLIEEIGSVTEPGNVRMCVWMMIGFMEQGKVDESSTALPAVVFSLPGFQNYLTEKFAHHHVSIEDVDGMSREYLFAYSEKVYA